MNWTSLITCTNLLLVIIIVVLWTGIKLLSEGLQRTNSLLESIRDSAQNTEASTSNIDLNTDREPLI